MKITFDLRKFLQRTGKTQKELCEELKIGKTQLQHLMEAEPATIHRGNLELVCSYLIDNGYADRAELAGSLLTFEPEEFWQMLAERERIDFFTGARRDQNRKDLLVVAADSVLETNVLFRSTRTEPIHRQSKQIIDQQIIHSWQGSGVDEVKIQESAVSEYRRFQRRQKNRAGVHCGSIKSDPAVEPAIARAWKDAKSFQSQDDTEEPQLRSCPFYLLYREEDPHPPSFCAGMRLSKDVPGDGPGIYFEKPGGIWERVAWDADTSDVAMVYYRFEREQEHLDMVLGGFSGRSTRCLAEFLRNQESEEFWPPVYSDEKMYLGIFLVQFTFGKRSRKNNHSIMPFEQPQQTKVIPLDPDVVEPRLKMPRGGGQKKAKKESESGT